MSGRPAFMRRRPLELMVVLGAHAKLAMVQQLLANCKVGLATWQNFVHNGKR
jgi:hypothetical protein